MEDPLKNAVEKQRDQMKTPAPYPTGGDACETLASGPSRQLGGQQAEELRRKLRAREDSLRGELRDVRRALDLLNSDESVQKVLEVISVANK